MRLESVSMVRDRASVRARISKSELFPMKCSYYQFQGGPSTHIHGFHFQRATKAERWFRCVKMYTYYVHVYIHTHTQYTHTRSDLTGERDTSRNLWLRERTVGRRTEIGNASVERSETLFVGLSTFPSATATMLALPWAAFIAQRPRRKNCPA